MGSAFYNILIIVLYSLFFGLAGACSVTEPYGRIATAADPVVNQGSDPEAAAALTLIEKMPDSPVGYNQLAVHYIKSARRTGDFSLNAKAEAAVTKALEYAPGDVLARKLHASLQLTFHRFDKGLELGKQLETEFPKDAFIYGLLTDANAELGNYQEARASAQKMVDLRPDSSSYARVAHIRSLFGDHNGAVEMYIAAARTADPGDKEAQSWCLVQLGDEYLKYGKFTEAEKVYDEALSIFPDFYLAVAAKGKIRATQNDLGQASKLLNGIQNRVPNVETAILLGDVYALQGDAENAKQQYALVEAIEQKIGVNTDQKRLALMWADQNTRLGEALEIGVREEAARKDIYTADTLAWCLYRAGRFPEAKAAIEKAMRLNSNDARMLYHAGMIEKDLGNRPKAVKLIGRALQLNPAFDLIQSQRARQVLETLKGKN